MTAELRNALRQAIDRHARAGIDWRGPRCAGCGVELTDPVTEETRYLDDCPTCSDRRRARRRRATAPRTVQLVLTSEAETR